MVVGTRCIVCDEPMGEYCCMSCGNTEFAPEEDDGYGDWLYEQMKDRRMMKGEKT